MYVKLFSSILTSSMWTEDATTRVVWITMLALADRDGYVRCSPSGLARFSNVSPAVCAAALAKFLAPDLESGTQEYEGRRIEEVAGGWFVLNYAKYRDMQNEEARKAQWRESSKAYREKKKASSQQPPADDADRQQTSAASANGQHTPADDQRKSAHTDTEAATEANRGEGRAKPPRASRPPRKGDQPYDSGLGEAMDLLERILAVRLTANGKTSINRVTLRNTLGEEALTAYDKIGGFDRVMEAASNGKERSFVARELRDALTFMRHAKADQVSA